MPLRLLSLKATALGETSPSTEIAVLKLIAIGAICWPMAMAQAAANDLVICHVDYCQSMVLCICLRQVIKPAEAEMHDLA